MSKVMTLEQLSVFTGLRGDYILEPWLQKGELVMLFAKRGLSKTFVVTKLINALTSGNSFLKWEPKKIFTCIHFSGEMGRAISADRYATVAKGLPYEARPGKGKFLCYENMHNGRAWNMTLKEDQNLFVQAAKGADLIVLDNLNTLTDGIHDKDTDFTQWRRVQDLLLYWRANNQAVLLVHHANKQGSQSGTMQRENIMDTVIEIRRSDLAHYKNGSSLEWHFTKSRSFFGADADPFHFSIQAIDGGAVFSWSPIKQMQIARYNELRGAIRIDSQMCEILGVTPYELACIKKDASRAEPPAPLANDEPVFYEEESDELF